MGGNFLKEFNNKAAESAERDQTACMCSLILLYTFRKISPWSRTRIVKPMSLIEKVIIRISGF